MVRDSFFLGTFDLLVYTDKTIATPKLWEESDPKYVVNSQEVSLRSFTTKVAFPA
jgi:mitotic spindle assembly checkpoint protein MAD2